MYVRYFSEGEFKGLRSIGMSHSADFKTWSEPVGLTYPNSPPQQMYTNQIAPYYRAPQHSARFPDTLRGSAADRTCASVWNRWKRGPNSPPRCEGSNAYTGAEVTDGLLMASRDGLTFRRWDEAFLRPGPQAEGRWIYGDNYQSYGLFETKSDAPGLPNEISLHFNEGSWRDDLHRLRRYTIRLDGFVSLHAPLSGGELIDEAAEVHRPTTLAELRHVRGRQPASRNPRRRPANRSPASRSPTPTNSSAIPSIRTPHGKEPTISAGSRDKWSDSTSCFAMVTCSRSNSWTESCDPGTPQNLERMTCDD